MCALLTRTLRFERPSRAGHLCRYDLILSSAEVARIHASTLILCWVGIPLLRFHPHPSQCRSIG